MNSPPHRLEWPCNATSGWRISWGSATSARSIRPLPASVQPYRAQRRYTLAFSESIDLDSKKSEDSSFTLIRHFDRFFVQFTAYYDQINDQSGFRLGIIPRAWARA